MDKTIIESHPWQQVCARYDAETTFMYLDPPYYQVQGYAHAFGETEYAAIADFMRNCKSKVLLSINGHEYIRELFKDFDITEVPGYKYSLNRNRHTAADELLIKNY